MNSDKIYQTNYINSWALVIGINKYKKASPLIHARNDAEGIIAVLKDEFGFLEKNITLLTDGKATRDNIINAFLEFTKEKVGQDDRILVFFAGHGYTKTGFRGEVGFLVPVDGTTNDLSTLIRWDDLTRNSELIPAKHMLFIMDACYGGLAVNRQVSPGTMRFAKDMLQRYSRQVIASGKGNESVADSGGPRPGHSIFTGYLLDALAGASASDDGIITANNIMAYLYNKVGKDYQSRQTPHYGYFDGDGDFIFNVSLLGELSSSSKDDKDILIEIPPTLLAQPDQQDNLPDKVKSYLSDTRYKIQLDDLVTDEIRRVLYLIGDKDFPVDTPGVSLEDFEQRLKHYEHIIENLQMMVTLISKWGAAELQGTLIKVFSRINEVNNVRSGKVVWLRLRSYPTMLLLYAIGIAALSSNNYENLSAVLTAPVGTRYSGDSTVEVIISTVENMLEVRRTGIFKKLPGFERNYVPESEYIFKVMQPKLEDLLFLGRSYEILFDKFEVLFALVYADLTYKEEGGHFWGPPGRFGWKYSSRVEQNPFRNVVAEAAQQQDAWGPIKAGLFQGTYSRFKTIADKYEAILRRLNWW